MVAELVELFHANILGKISDKELEAKMKARGLDDEEIALMWRVREKEREGLNDG